MLVQDLHQIKANDQALVQELANQVQQLKVQLANMSIQKKKTTHKSYCWTHGFGVSKNHNSGNCRNPATGHQRTASGSNTMGGSTKGSGSVATQSTADTISSGFSSVTQPTAIYSNMAATSPQPGIYEVSPTEQNTGE